MVTTTAQMILNWAYAKSKESEPGTIASESAELLQFVIRSMRGLWAVAARVNPTFFATSAAVAYSAPGWKRPADAEMVLRIETSAGAEVVLVDFDQRAAEPGKPAVYALGQIYRSAGNANDPTSGSLTFFFSKRPTDPANLDATLDPLWEGAEQFNELLVLEVAIYLALKDDRQTEAANLIKERDKWLNLYVAFLEHETVGVRRSWGHTKRFNTQTRVPITSLLAGGAAAA